MEQPVVWECLTKELKDNIIVHNGDIISNLNLKNLIKFHETINSDITVCAKEHINSSPFGEILYSGHKVKNLENRKILISNAEYIFLKTLKKLVSKMDMVKPIQLRISQGFKANIYPIYEYWADIEEKTLFKKF